MLTTITVNGSEGLRFLNSLSRTERSARPLPPALAAIIEHVVGQVGEVDPQELRLEVELPQAEEIAAFVADAGGGHPLLFSAQLGDLVVLVRDVLAEVSIGKREARTWQFLPAGTVGRLVGHRGDLGKLALVGGAAEGREHAYVSDRCTTRRR